LAALVPLVAVDPAQMGAFTVGTAVLFPTVTEPVVLLQPVVPSVKVKVAEPGVKPVTNPALVTEATVGLLLIQVPPEVGERFVVSSTQIVAGPVMLTDGKAFTVTDLVLLVEHPPMVSAQVSVPLVAEVEKSMVVV